MNENVSVISECDNLEIENYLKSCGSYPKNTEVKFVESHLGVSGCESSRNVCGLIQYSKCMLNKFRNDLRECETPDFERHIIIEKERLNELLKSKIKEYMRDHPVQENSVERFQHASKVVHFKEKPKPLVRNVRRIKSFDRHIHCMANKKPAKPVFVSRKSQQIHDNQMKSLRIGRNIVVDPSPVTSYYPRRIFNDTKLESQESHGPTWHDRLMGLPRGTSSNCTIVTTTTTSQVIKKSEIKILRYNFNWGGTDAMPNETTDDKKVQNIDQTTQTESNVVTTKSVECFTEQFCEIGIAPENREQSPTIIEPSAVQVSAHETDENVQVTVGSSFVYEYEMTFDESGSESELSETVKPTQISRPLVSKALVKPKKPNILLESVVYADPKCDQRDAEIQTEFEPIREIVSRKDIHITSDEGELSHKKVELELSRLDEEIMQDKFKLLSVLRHSPADIRPQSNTTQLCEISCPRDLNISQPSEIQLQLTPLKPRPAVEFMPSPLELSSIRPLSLAHKNSTFDMSNEKCRKAINKIQMDAARNPFSPKTETDDIAKRAAEKFLKSTVSNTHRAADSESNSISSLYVSNVMLTSSSEYESDSTVTSHRYAQLKRFTNSGKLSEGEVPSLGEVRKFTDDSE